jgi:hypothetical protein
LTSGEGEPLYDEEEDFWPQQVSGSFEEEKIFLPLSGIKSPFFGHYTDCYPNITFSTKIDNAYASSCSLFFQFSAVVCNDS